MEIKVDLRNGRSDCPFRYYGMQQLNPYCLVLNRDCTGAGKKLPPHDCPICKEPVIVSRQD